MHLRIDVQWYASLIMAVILLTLLVFEIKMNLRNEQLKKTVMKKQKI